MEKNISVIIPAYNEGEYIKDLIAVLLKSKNVFEVILVDDKSKENYSDMYDTIQGIKVIHKQENQGKDRAIKTGIEIANSEYILILDGDLKNIQTKQIEFLSRYTLQKKDIVCILRGKDYLAARIVGTTYMMLGEHLLSKQIIEKNFDSLFNNNSWNFDNEINNIVLQLPKDKVAYLEFQGVEHQLKGHKLGLIAGLKADLKMIYEVIFIKYRVYKFLTTRIKLLPYLRNRESI